MSYKSTGPNIELDDLMEAIFNKPTNKEWQIEEIYNNGYIQFRTSKEENEKQNKTKK